jgi:putative transposase
MPRLPRVTVPGLPHHVTQRGNRKMPVFLTDRDRNVYLKLLRTQCSEQSVKIWAYCLMDNHVHFVAVPDYEFSLSRLFQRVHGDYAHYFNAQYTKCGHLWQGRFKGTVLDPPHLWNAVRYVERNPVRAGKLDCAEQYSWSSAAAHCGLRKDPLVSNDLPLLSEISDWSAWLAVKDLEEELRLLRERTRTGRPCGSEEFTRELEAQLGRALQPRQWGKKAVSPAEPLRSMFDEGDTEADGEQTDGGQSTLSP